MKIRSAWAVCKWQLLGWTGNPRVILALLIAIVAALMEPIRFLDFAHRMDEPIQVLEPFIYDACANFIMTLLFLGSLLLFADAPFTEQSALYSITRSGKAAWILGKIIYLLIAALIYVAVAAVSTVLYAIKDAFAGNIWSTPFYDMVVKNAAVNDYRMGMDNKAILVNFSPYAAFAVSFMLSVCYLFVNGLLLFAINIGGNRILGFAVVSAVHCFGYLFSGYSFSRILPFTHALLSNHSFVGAFGNASGPGVIESFIYFLLMIVFLCTVIYQRSQNIDFRISVGTKQ